MAFHKWCFYLTMRQMTELKDNGKLVNEPKYAVQGNAGLGLRFSRQARVDSAQREPKNDLFAKINPGDMFKYANK